MPSLAEGRGKDSRKTKNTKTPEAACHCLGLLPAEANAMLQSFRMIKDKQAKSVVDFFIRRALKTECGIDETQDRGNE